MIRVAKKSELKKIVEMKLTMFEEVGEDDHLSDNAYKNILKVYKRLYDENKMRHFVFEIETEIVACAGGFIKEDIPHCFFKPSFYGFIGDVYTFPEYRKNGYATKLTKRVVKWIKEKGVKSIRLFASRKGKVIYEKIGFEKSDEMILELN